MLLEYGGSASSLVVFPLRARPQSFCHLSFEFLPHLTLYLRLRVFVFSHLLHCCPG